MKHLITIFFLLVSTCIAVDNRLITIAYKDGLAEGWVTKIDDAVNELQGITNHTHVCYWNGYTNQAGQVWYAVTFWADYQFTNASLTVLEEVMNKKVPKPFRDDITCTYGTPQNCGLYTTNKMVMP